MKNNMGSTDKIIRLIAAAIMILLYAFNIVSGTLGIVLIIVAAVFALTSFISFCPLYTICGISSRNEKNK